MRLRAGHCLSSTFIVEQVSPVVMLANMNRLRKTILQHFHSYLQGFMKTYLWEPGAQPNEEYSTPEEQAHVRTEHFVCSKCKRGGGSTAEPMKTCFSHDYT